MLGKIFLKGLKAILPVAITLTLIIWVLDAIEKAFGFIIISLFGQEHYFPGLGLIVGLILVFFVGLLMNAWIVQKFHTWTEKLLKQIPIVKTLYSAVSDVMNFLKSKKGDNQQQVVMVSIMGCHLLGFVTRESFKDLPSGVGTDENAAVYLPMSYQIGGYTVIVPKSSLTRINMSVEEAMRFSITAGMQMRSNEEV